MSRTESKCSFYIKIVFFSTKKKESMDFAWIDFLVYSVFFKRNRYFTKQYKHAAALVASNAYDVHQNQL